MEEPYKITEEDVTSMVTFLHHYYPKNSSREMAVKLLSALQRDIHNASEEEIIALYEKLIDEGSLGE